MRIVWGFVALLAVVVIAAFVYASTLIDQAIEKGGSKVLGVPVTLGMAKLEPFSGELWLNDLVVANPEGYETENAFKVQEVYVKLDVSSLFSNVIRVDNVAVRGPVATFEGEYAQNNFKDIYANIQKNTATRTTEPKQTEPAKEMPVADVSTTVVEIAEENVDQAVPTKLVVGEFLFENGLVNAVLNTPVGQKSLDRQLPDIRLTNLGQDEGGLTPEELLQRVVSPVQKEIQRVAHGAMDELKGVLQNGVDTFKSRVKSLTNDVKSLF